ncbi:MAG TPA: type II toxin-antitoxin system HipA family toxin [Burkholderiaceae bacterium]|nr:type II toxin-antitoxin system HipA family toxin [Burkholderiaceae bacterium]
MIEFARRVNHLEVRIGGQDGGYLRRESQFRFTYAAQASMPVSLIMPLADREFVDNALFAVMDMNLPEGFLLRQIYERSPKNPPTEMHLLELMGDNGIGRLGYRRPGAEATPLPKALERSQLLREGAGHSGEVFAALVDSFLATGSGLSGVQPKIVVPERATFPIPNLIVKTSGDDYPGLVANEYLCLQVAASAGLPVPRHELSDDGALLVIDRFDLLPGGKRLGFEDVAALADLRVGGALSDRKYRGSYEDVASLIDAFASDRHATLPMLFEYVVLSVMLRNGDGHLKNFGVLYDDERVWLAPVFDVVTTTIYPYERSGGIRVTDRTMALKLRRGKGSKDYPMLEELVSFGNDVCRHPDAASVVERVRGAMNQVLRAHLRDERLPESMLRLLRVEWETSMDWYRPVGRKSADP